MGLSEPLKTALDAFIYISFAIPLSYSKKRKEACLNGLERHTKKPDIDNVVKAVLDGCDKVIFKNDCQIVNLYVTKKYGEPCVEVLIRETE
jgi:Holliday junction resolvase RusA-like endonuclease